MKDLRTFFPTVCSEELISIDSSLSKGCFEENYLPECFTKPD